MKPKSILRSPRFKPNAALASRYYGSERRVLDFETEQLVAPDTPVSAADVYLDSEQRAMIGGERRVATQATISERVVEPQQQGRLSTSREMNSSHELSPPRNSAGFMDKEGFELSPIRPNRIVEKPITHADSVPISHLAGHPAEKHLRDSMATFREMRGGVIADRVIEEDYFADPTLEIDVSFVA